MDLRDLDWIRDSGFAVRRESGQMDGRPWVILSFPETASHHGTRCLWRLVVFSRSAGGLRARDGEGQPLFSIDLERDILGGFCLGLLAGPSHRILARYGAAPSYESFRERALAEARGSLLSKPAGAGGHSASVKARRHSG